MDDHPTAYYLAAYDYRDEEGAMSLYPNPGKNSCDNLILFSSVFMVLLMHNGSYLEKEHCRDWFYDFLKSHELFPGGFTRRLGDKTPSAHDDHWGLVVACRIFGISNLCRDVYEHGISHAWNWGGDWLGRITAFPPVVKCAAGIELNLFNKIAIALAFMLNTLEHREEASGRQLLWLATKVCYGKYWIIDRAIEYWEAKCKQFYPQKGLAEMMEIYYGTVHPFHFFAGKEFL